MLRVFLGEMGRSFVEFEELTPYQTILSVQGYLAREERHRRVTWESTRWMTHVLMKAPYDKKKVNLLKLEDLLPLPWDEKKSITKDEIRERLKRVAKRHGINPTITLPDGEVISGT